MQSRKILLLLFSCCITIGLTAQTKSIRITDLEKMIAESKTPLIINFWATYCGPCIAEMPAFQQLADKYSSKGLKLVFVSLDMRDDYPAKVDSFVAKRKVRHQVLWLNETDADYFCPKVDQKWSGAIPATLLVNKTKGIRRFFEEEMTEQELEKEIMAILD
ncbi:MAG: redoxin [Citrobacter freundii]|nr:MAG: redoxin [Citrobacter freundii]